MATPLQIVNVFDLAATDGTLPVPVLGTTATGLELLCSAAITSLDGVGPHLGVDLLRLAPGESFPLHTHPGNHLLLVVRGAGTVTYGGTIYETRPGDLYLVDAQVPHAVGAIETHTLLSFGAPHVHLDDPARMSVVEPLATAGGS